MRRPGSGQLPTSAASLRLPTSLCLGDLWLALVLASHRCPGTSTIQRCIPWPPLVDAFPSPSSPSSDRKRINDDTESRLLPDGIAEDPGPALVPSIQGWRRTPEQWPPKILGWNSPGPASLSGAWGIDTGHLYRQSRAMLARCLVTTSLFTPAGDLFWFQSCVNFYIITMYFLIIIYIVLFHRF